MQIGYFGANLGAFDHPDAIERLATTAEGLGFESLWTGEHVVLVDLRAKSSSSSGRRSFRCSDRTRARGPCGRECRRVHRGQRAAG